MNLQGIYFKTAFILAMLAFYSKGEFQAVELGSIFFFLARLQYPVIQTKLIYEI